MQTLRSSTRFDSLAECKVARKAAARLHDGFTLIELLVVAVIAAVLMGLVMVALAGAQQDAAVAKTRATIRKIDSIIQQRYEEYLYSPIDFVCTTTGTFPAGYNTATFPSGTGFSPSVVGDTLQMIHARIRLQLVRDLMRLEMPDCPGDMFYFDGSQFQFRIPNTYSAFCTTGGDNVSVMLTDAPKFAQIESMIKQRWIDPVTGLPKNVISRNFNAELLFLIVETSYINGSFGIESFANSEIGDTDGDGLREFLDAWGRPIQWLRWPAGYNEDIQLSQYAGNSLKGDGEFAIIDRFNPDPAARYWPNSGITSSIDGSDPLDPNKVDLGYKTGNPVDIPMSTLRPLIVSAGQDGIFGLRFLWTETPSRMLFSLSDASMDTPSGTYNWPDPFFPRLSSNFAIARAGTVFVASVNQSLGGVLNANVDKDADGVASTFQPAIGVKNQTEFEYDIETAITGSDNGEINRVIRDSVADNVNNFDETGGSL